MEILTEFLIEQALIMVPVLYILAEMVIKPTKAVNDKWIPLILLTVSLATTPAVIGAYIPDNFVQAVLVTGGAVLSNQIYKQATKKGE